MGYTAGMPVMKLDNRPHFSTKSDHCGNAKAVAEEGLNERHSSDEDINRELTATNFYYGEIQSGKELVDYWNDMADNYRVKLKNGKERKLRSDAGIGFAGISKPAIDYMNTLSPALRQKYFDDTLEILNDIYGDYGMVIDTAVIHYDEGNPHMHYYGHDPEYKLGKKLGLPLYKRLNTEYPARMRELGWELDDLVGYDVDKAKEMSDDERKTYNAECRAKRESHGLSASEYKARKKQQRLDEKEQSLDDREEKVNAKADALDTRETHLNAQISDLDKTREEMFAELSKELEKARELSTAPQDDRSQAILAYIHRFSVMGEDGVKRRMDEAFLRDEESRRAAEVQKAEQRAAALKAKAAAEKKEAERKKQALKVKQASVMSMSIDHPEWDGDDWRERCNESLKRNMQDFGYGE